jgi:RNA recognition motif-containing protein
MKSLFVGNLNFQPTETDLGELFKTFGQVTVFTSPWIERPAEHGPSPVSKCPMTARQRRQSQAWTAKILPGGISR